MTKKQETQNVPIDKLLHMRVKIAAAKKDMSIKEWLEIAIVRLLRSPR